MEVWVPIDGMQIVQNLQCQINCFLQKNFLLDRLGQNAYPQNFVRGRLLKNTVPSATM